MVLRSSLAFGWAVVNQGVLPERSFIMLMPGILLDLPGSCFTLKMIEFFDRQAIQEFDSPFQLKRGLQELLVFLLVRTLEHRRIRDTPMRGDRLLPGKTGLRSRASSQTVMTKSK